MFVNSPLSLKERYGALAQAGGIEPPFGLCYLAATLRKKGYRVSIVDAETLQISCEQTVNLVLEKNPKYVAITGVTASIYNVAEIAKRIKQFDKKIITIVGGPHITSLPLETMKIFPEFDIGVVGEGEETLNILLNKLEHNLGLESIQGLVFRQNGKIFLTNRRCLIKNLDTLAFPAFDLLPQLSTNYRIPTQSIDRLPAISLVTSRGCTGRCIFCDRSVFGNYCRAHSAEYLMHLIKMLCCDYKIKCIMFEDDNFLLFRPRLFKLLRMLKDEQLDLTWSCTARVDMVDEEMLRRLREAGCWQILYGIESASQKILDFLKKGITIEQVKKTLKMTKKAKIKVKGFFILGNPLETKETLNQTLDFINKADLDDISITFFTPYPGTEICPIAENYGSTDKDWRKMNQFEIVFVPKDLTKKDIELFSRRAYRKFYFRLKTMLSYLKRARSLYQLKELCLSGLALLKYIFVNKEPSNEVVNN